MHAGNVKSYSHTFTTNTLKMDQNRTQNDDSQSHTMYNPTLSTLSSSLRKASRLIPIFDWFGIFRTKTKFTQAIKIEVVYSQNMINIPKMC